MLSNVISAGKDIANKIGNKFLNLSEVEAKIKDATNDDAWGPSGLLMKEIAEDTFTSMNFNEIMIFLWYRIFTERPPNVRRTYKGIILLSYILLNGSDYVAVRCRDHIDDVRRLRAFTDQNGVPDASIRKKATDICDLLNDSQRLKDERDKAKTNQRRLYGQKSATTADSTEGDRRHVPRQSLGDFDSWEPKSKSIPYAIGESFVNFVSVFTQNISGPPPTETHDNFDMPSYYDTEPCDEAHTDTHSSIVRTDDKICSNNECQSVTKSSVKLVEAVKIRVIDEAPIIDFTEPAADERRTVSVGAIGSSNVRNQEDDFGDFRSWDDSSWKSTVRPAAVVQTHDFFPNFDSLPRDQKSARNIEIDLTPVQHSQDKSKVDTKLGSTWADMGSLKIDLDNVCGARRPMYSKS